jgi:hypothetical protein
VRSGAHEDADANRRALDLGRRVVLAHAILVDSKVPAPDVVDEITLRVLDHGLDGHLLRRRVVKISVACGASSLRRVRPMAGSARESVRTPARPPMRQSRELTLRLMRSPRSSSGRDRRAMLRASALSSPRHVLLSRKEPLSPRDYIPHAAAADTGLHPARSLCTRARDFC